MDLILAILIIIGTIGIIVTYILMWIIPIYRIIIKKQRNSYREDMLWEKPLYEEGPYYLSGDYLENIKMGGPT